MFASPLLCVLVMSSLLLVCMCIYKQHMCVCVCVCVFLTNPSGVLLVFVLFNTFLCEAPSRCPYCPLTLPHCKSASLLPPSLCVCLCVCVHVCVCVCVCVS